MSTFNKLKSDFKRLVEYQTYRIEDVEDPHFVVAEDGLEPNRDEENQLPQEPPATDPAQQPAEPTPAPAPEPEPPVTAEPQPSVEPEIPPSAPTPEPAPAPVFDYTKVITNLNDITMSLHKLSNKFDDVKSKLDYMEKVVDEVREPSNEEKLLSQTKQSYPFNVSMVDAWKNLTGELEGGDEEVISTPKGEIKKVGNEYEMNVDIDTFPKPVYHNQHGRIF